MRSCTVASYNVHWGRRPRVNTEFDLIETCRRLDADVLALQEVWRPDGATSVAHDVASVLGYECYETWTCRTVVDPKCQVVAGAGAPAGDGDCGIALLTRVPRGPVTEHHLGGVVSDVADRKPISADGGLDGGPPPGCPPPLPPPPHLPPLL